MESLNETFVMEFVFLTFTKKSTRYSRLYITIFLFLYLVIICGNVLLMLVIKVDSRLHTPMYFFVFSLSFLDICYTTTIVPQVICNLIRSRASILFLNCASQMFFMIMFGALQLLIVTVMAYDRYIAISKPLHYKMIMSWKTCSMILGFTIIIGFLVSFVFTLSAFSLPFCCKAKIQHFLCDIGEILTLSSADEQRKFQAGAIPLIIGVIFDLSLFLFMVISYVYIVSAVMKIRTTNGRRKAFSTCSSHITVVVVEFACIGFLYFRPKQDDTLDKDRVFVMVFTYTTPILNPIIYTLRNKAIKQGFRKLTSSILH